MRELGGIQEAPDLDYAVDFLVGSKGMYSFSKIGTRAIIKYFGRRTSKKIIPAIAEEGSSVVKTLTKQQQSSIRSYEKLIKEHKKKIIKFRKNPTVRPGMEDLPKEIIKKQQQERIKKLETEINTFKNNIEKIKRGEIDS